METEIWKSHPDIVGIEISNLGRVRTLDRVISSESGTRFLKGRVLKQWENGTGYLQVNIQIDGKQTKKLIHRLVAQTFIKNSNNWPEVNHKDNDRTNNHVDNLEFCTRSYNMKYKEKFGISNTETIGRPVFAIDLNTMEVSRFRSQHEAGDKLMANKGHINEVIKGKRKQTGGFWFTNADNKAVETTRDKLGDIVASKVEKLMKRKTSNIK